MEKQHCSPPQLLWTDGDNQDIDNQDIDNQDIDNQDIDNQDIRDRGDVRNTDM